MRNENGCHSDVFGAVLVLVRPSIEFREERLRIRVALFSYMAASMTEEEFLLLCEENALDYEILLDFLLPDEKETTYDPLWPKLDISQLSDIQCREYFRFEHAEPKPLKAALRIPDEFVLENGIRLSGMNCMCILLRRLSYPNSLVDLEQLFDRPKTTLSMAVSSIVDYIYGECNHTLTDLNQAWLKNRLQMYADVVHAKSGTPVQLLRLYR